MQGAIFTFGGDGHQSLARALDGAFTVVDFQTTGLAPSQGGRIIEVAVVRVEDGAVGQPWATLVNPGRDTGATFIHHSETSDVADAPTFAEIAPSLLSLLDVAVVVAHNAPFDEEFLAAELARAGFPDLGCSRGPRRNSPASDGSTGTRTTSPGSERPWFLVTYRAAEPDARKAGRVGR